MDQDKEKAALIGDERLQTLEALSGISLLPAEQVKQWRSDWASLQVAESIDPKTIQFTANPSFNFSPRSEGSKASASERLAQLDTQLTEMLSEWTQSLKIDAS